MSTRRRARYTAEPLANRSGGRRKASYDRIREAIANGDQIFDRSGNSLTTGSEFTRSIAPSEVTPVGRAFHEVLDAALDGLEAAARDVVMPDAVRRAPLLTPESLPRAGRVGGNQGGVPEELKKSARVEMDREHQQVELSFNTIYATLQHERMDWHHPDGQAKYLEDAMVLNRSETLAVIAEHVREVTK